MRFEEAREGELRGPFPVLTLGSVLWSSGCEPLAACPCHHISRILTSGAGITNESFFHESLWPWCFVTRTEVTNGHGELNICPPLTFQGPCLGQDRIFLEYFLIFNYV